MFRKTVHLLLVFAFILPVWMPVTAAAQAAPQYNPSTNGQPSIQVSTATPTLPPNAAPTATPPPNAAALLVEVDPSLDLENYSPYSAFILNFSQPMNSASSPIPLLAYPYLDGTAAWNQAKTTLTFTPSDRFTPGQAYTLFLDPDLKSASGESFAEIQSWQVNVLTGASVLSRSPGYESLASRRPDIALTFDRSMDSESVAQALSMQPEVAYALSWSSNVLHIALQEALDPGMRYSFTLASTAADADGVPMAGDYRWDYWVPGFVIEVVSPTPQYNRVTLNLSHAVTTGKDAPPFSISPEVDGEWRWNSTVQAEFRPAETLEYGTRYIITLDGTLADAEGDNLPSPAGAMTFNAPAPISAVYPPSGTDDVPLEETEIRISFSVPMDHRSTESAFSISPQVAGEFEWRGDVLVYVLTEKMESYTTYIASLGPTTKDAENKPILVDAYSWSFETRGSNYYAERGATSFAFYGPNAQVVDAAGRRAVHLSVAEQELTLNFTVYELELGAFAALYAADFDYSDWDSSAPIDTSGLAPT